jgi:hypothetical protein
MSIDVKKELDQRIQAELEGQVVGEIKLLVPPKTVDDDVPKLVVLDDHRRRIAVVHCSPAISPRLAARAGEMATTAKAMIGEELGRHVLEPFSEWDLGGLSYTISVYCEPLSRGRLRWPMQRFSLRPRILDWLHGVARETVSRVEGEALHASFVKPLWSITERTEMPDRIRSAAERAIGRIDSGHWSPRHVLSHNDFWTGNILIAPSRAEHPATKWMDRFTVIDWPTGLTDGYPFADLIKFSNFFRVAARSMHKEVVRHCEVVDCELEDGAAYVLAGMGYLGLNREHFPLDRYLALTEESYEMMTTLVGAHHGQ